MQLWRRKLFFVFLTAAGFTSCRTIEQMFSVIEVHLGGEVSLARFYTKNNQFDGLPSPLGSSKASGTDERVRYRSEERAVYRAFTTVQTPLKPLPVIGELPVLNLLRFSVTLNTPRVFRGTLYNYPDDGRDIRDPVEYVFAETHPNRGPFLNRSMDYLFEEWQAYVTFLIGGSFHDFHFYLGFNWGQEQYSFDIFENNMRVSHVVNRYRPVTSQSVIIGYKFGREGPAWLPGNTFAYVEVNTELTERHALKTDLRRTNGSAPDSLFVNATYVRIGIRKTLQLVDEDGDNGSGERVRESRKI